MKTILFYFTGTGNSLAIARKLAKALEDTNLVSIASALKGKPDFAAERIGLVFPTYGGTMPRPVLEFIKKLPAGQSKYYFAIATCGRMPGAIIGRVSKLLKDRGLRLSAGFIVPMPGNFIPLYEAIPMDNQQKLFEEADFEIPPIAGIIKNNKCYIPRISIMDRIYTQMMLMLFSKNKNPAKSFQVDNKCNSCGTCEKICPVYNIRMISGKPAWSDHCAQCFACLQWCPQAAVQFGEKTPGRKRYHHPDIQLEDLLSEK